MAAQRLVSRLELSRRLTGATKSTVYRQCEKGGKLHAAMVGDKIDLEHKNARMYCAEFGYKEPDLVAERRKAAERAKAADPYDTHKPPTDVIAPDGEDDHEYDASDYMSMPLREIVKRYGRQAQFKEYVSAYKILVATQAAEEKMARDRKEFAHFSHIERLAMHIDGLHKALLTDAVKSIADIAKTLASAGASDIEIRKAIAKVLEQQIKMTKAQSERMIRSAKS